MLPQTGVVARGNPVETLVYVIEKGAELDQRVAENVRARRAPCPELVEHVGDDLVVILLLQGDDLERDAGPGAHLADETQILLPGAGAEERELVLEPDLEVESNDLEVRVLGQAAQRHRTVDAT